MEKFSEIQSCRIANLINFNKSLGQDAVNLIQIILFNKFLIIILKKFLCFNISSRIFGIRNIM